MRKKFALYIFVILYLFCINVNTVHAEDCVSLKTQIDNYDAYTELLSTLDCTNDGDLSNVATCNEINVKKNVVVTKILKAQDEKKVCSNEQSRVDQIIEDNKNKCSKIFDDSFTNFVNGVMVVFYILGPILLLLFGSLDFAKATASAEEDALKKASTKFVKRLVATFLLYATPTIINLILSFNMTDKYLSGNAYSCDYKYLVYNKKYILKYTPTSNGSRSKNCGGDILASAEKVHSKFECKNQYSDASPNGECWTYNLSSSLLRYTAEDALNNPNKVVVCATFVSLALYDAGYLSNDEFSNSTTGLEAILKSKGWKAITNANDMQAGDVMIQSNRGHIQIYAGNDMIYNAGGNYSVQKGAPYKSSDWRSRFTIGYRAPNTSKSCSSGNYTGGDYSKFISYDQTDPEWGNMKACSNCDINAHVGCYLTAYADIVASWRDDSVTPKTLTEKYKNKFSSSNTAAFTDQIVPDYNLNYERINDISTSEGRERLYEVLGEGKSVLIYLSSPGAYGVNVRSEYPLCAKNGTHNAGERITSHMHWVVLVGVDSDQTLAFANPNGGGIDYITYDMLSKTAEDRVGHVAW